MVELASDDRGRRTREGKESAAHVCSAIRAAQTVGWTPLVVGARSPCCRSVLFVITADIIYLLYNPNFYHFIIQITYNVVQLIK